MREGRGALAPPRWRASYQLPKSKKQTKNIALDVLKVLCVPK